MVCTEQIPGTQEMLGKCELQQGTMLGQWHVASYILF